PSRFGVSGLRRSVRLVVVAGFVGRCCVGGRGLVGLGRGLRRRLGRRLGGGGLLGRVGRRGVALGLRDVGGLGRLRRGLGGGRLGGRSRRLAGGQLAALLLAEDLVQRDRDPREERVQAAGEAGDRRGDHAHELAVEHVAGGQARDREDLLGVEGGAVEQPALEREQLGLAAER